MRSFNPGCGRYVGLYLLIFSVCLLSVRPVAAMTMEQAVRLAVTGSPDVQASRISEASSKLRLETARKNTWPAMTLNGSYLVSSARDGITDFVGANGSREKDLTADLIWPIFRGGALLARIDGAGAMVKAGLHQTETKRIKIAGITVSAFIRAAGLEQIVQIYSAFVDQLGEHLRKVKIAYQNGTVPEIDINRAETALEQTRSKALSLKEDSARAREMLSILIGGNPEGPLNVSDWGGLSPLLSKDITGLTEKMVNNFPSLKASMARIMAARASVRVAKAARLPKIDIIAGTGWQTVGHVRTNNIGWQAGITISFPFFDAGLRERRLEISRNSLHEEEFLKDTVLRHLRQSLVDDVRLHDRSLYILQSLNHAVLTAGKALREARAGYREGVLSHLELMDAWRTLTDIEVNRWNAMMELKDSSYRITLLTDGERGIFR